MTTGTEPRFPWRDDPSSLDTLGLIAEGLSSIAGFGVATINIVVGDDFVTVAVAGDPDARRRLLFHATPLGVIEGELQNAESWGAFQFISHEHSDPSNDEHFWVPDIEVSDTEDAWHPLDMLIAPLTDDAGRLRGLINLDLPRDGRKPGPEQRVVMDKFAAQARHAVLATLERAELSERWRLATAAREAVRRASVQLEPRELLDEIRPALLAGFRGHGLWLQVFDDGGPGTGIALDGDGGELQLPEHLLDDAFHVAQLAWKEGQVPVVDEDGPVADGVLLTESGAAAVRCFLDSIGVGSMLFVPVGAGDSVMGNLVVTRLHGSEEWSDVETEAALDIGHDLGRILLNQRTFETERALVETLRELDSYKSELIATVAHELKSPLSAVVGHLELLETHPLASDPAGKSSLDSIERGAARLRRTVEDLLVLAEVANPQQEPVRGSVDLRDVVVEVRSLTSLEVENSGHSWHDVLPERPVVVTGDQHQLERLLTNLVSNAVKYSPDGGAITVELHDDGHEAWLCVADQGLGISPADQERLFGEFFRSADPRARSQPGTGLGLTIVSRIVERHHGRIEVDSALGRGSTFRVVLPVH